MTVAFYNEIDEYAANWLRNLIDAGHIAPGVVDTRSISEIEPDELRRFTQCHFFAGIGVWSLALRRAGWPDSRPVWTGSCPCQPFSVAGRGAGFSDERHLWPHWHHLIRECQPVTVFGEQVASKDGLAWLDLVHADLEGEGYAVGAVDLCAAGVGAPHIRQRLWFVAQRLAYAGRAGNERVRRSDDAHGAAAAVEGEAQQRQRGRVAARPGGASGGVDHHHHQGLEGHRIGHRAEDGHGARPLRPVAQAGESGGLAHHHHHHRREEQRAAWVHGDGAPGHDTAGCGEDERLADAASVGSPTGARLAGAHDRAQQPQRQGNASERPGPTHGHWRAADWLYCRDGRWRPVEPGTFPLAHGAAARVGRLRAYGNAIVADAAAEVIDAYLFTTTEDLLS